MHHGGEMTKGQNNEFYFVIGDLEQDGIFQNIISSKNIVTRYHHHIACIFDFHQAKI